MRRKFIVYGLSLIVIVFAIYDIRYTIYAAESTPSADIRAKLEELKKDIASRAAKLKQEVSNKLRDKAYVGVIKAKSPSSMTLATKNGPKIININQDTEFSSKVKGKKYSQKLVSEEDYLASLGDVDETGVLTAKRVILLPTPNSEFKTYLWGQVVSISDKLITLKDKNGKSIAVSLIPSSVKVLDFVILTGNFGKNDIFISEFVHVIPKGGILKPKKVATPSAKPKSSTKPVAR